MAGIDQRLSTDCDRFITPFIGVIQEVAEEFQQVALGRLTPEPPGCES